MGLRFRKRIKVMPGIGLNISKTGVSATVGKPGASVNIGKRGVTGTAGVPGTGLSHTEQLIKAEGCQPSGMSAGKLLGLGILGLFLALVILGAFGVI